MGWQTVGHPQKMLSVVLHQVFESIWHLCIFKAAPSTFFTSTMGPMNSCNVKEGTVTKPLKNTTGSAAPQPFRIIQATVLVSRPQVFCFGSVSNHFNLSDMQ